MPHTEYTCWTATNGYVACNMRGVGRPLWGVRCAAMPLAAVCTGSGNTLGWAGLGWAGLGWAGLGWAHLVVFKVGVQPLLHHEQQAVVVEGLHSRRPHDAQAPKVASLHAGPGAAQQARGGEWGAGSIHYRPASSREDCAAAKSLLEGVNSGGVCWLAAATHRAAACRALVLSQHDDTVGLWQRTSAGKQRRRAQSSTCGALAVAVAGAQSSQALSRCSRGRQNSMCRVLCSACGGLTVGSAWLPSAGGGGDLQGDRSHVKTNRIMQRQLMPGCGIQTQASAQGACTASNGCCHTRTRTQLYTPCTPACGSGGKGVGLEQQQDVPAAHATHGLGGGGEGGLGGSGGEGGEGGGGGGEGGDGGSGGGGQPGSPADTTRRHPRSQWAAQTT